MSIMTKWALQAAALFVLGWMAMSVATWSDHIANGTGSDRLAELNTDVLSSQVLAVSSSPVARGE
ncbi:MULTISPECIES: hypothetical protein [Pseudomonas]|uniref:Uncharacterized protein n=5 Tax=Pseudomonas TaxID=286 RepID=A0AAJ4B949_PSESX|nr:MULTISPECIES: hypothetical protein [Pseudomonas]MCW6055208.1 hypothetical protein [Pseudomonas fragi]AKF47839.1 hypothetical protein PsyrB_21970 [Pseudomonas syringae pv. syringae B301D]AVB27556.1 hypothetical protein BKC06_021935 [Pseudomonas syringae pv. syringae]EGH69655.1 hypothetical protein PSYAR_03749 [Pseudomonas syringae pv. aceris str. M302273]EXL33640.1 hypothetical protein PssB301D_00021 [Pseudomonas syringae pv. syringae str. B301D-R]